MATTAERIKSGDIIAGDLTEELYREIVTVYPDKRETVYTIHDPITLYRRPGGTTHRILDKAGVVHLVLVPGPNRDGTVTVHRWAPRDINNPVQF